MSPCSRPGERVTYFIPVQKHQKLSWFNTFERFPAGTIQILGPITLAVHDWSHPQEGHPRMFGLSFLEWFTCAHPRSLITVYLPGGFILGWLCLRAGTSIAGAIGGYLAGLVLWTFLEYVFHRFPFHLTPHNKLEVIIGYLIHGVHHAFPDRSAGDAPRHHTAGRRSHSGCALAAGVSAASVCRRHAPVPHDVLHYAIKRSLKSRLGRFLLTTCSILRCPRLRCDVSVLGPRFPNDAVIDASHLRINEAVGIVYFAYLAAAALVVPLPRARRLLVWVVAPLAIGLELTAARGHLDWLWRDLRDWLPALVILIGYFATGAFFVKPSTRLESWLKGWDDRLIGGTRFERLPAVLRLYLDVVYVSCFLMIPAGYGVLLWAGGAALTDARGHGGICRGTLLAQARPPWAIEAAVR